jgi:hypothetical protein
MGGIRRDGCVSGYGHLAVILNKQMHLWFLQNSGKFLTSWETISSSERNMVHGFIYGWEAILFFKLFYTDRNRWEWWALRSLLYSTKVTENVVRTASASHCRILQPSFDLFIATCSTIGYNDRRTSHNFYVLLKVGNLSVV